MIPNLGVEMLTILKSQPPGKNSSDFSRNHQATMLVATTMGRYQKYMKQ